MGDDEPAGSSGGQFPGSDLIALVWVNEMIAGEFPTAYDAFCPEIKDQIAQIAAEQGTTEDQLLAGAFYQETLGGRGVLSGNLDSTAYSAGDDLDISSFELQLDDGSTYELQVAVDSDLAVCGFS